MNVIACDKRGAFAQGSDCDEAIQFAADELEGRIASRSLLSGGAVHRPVGSQ
jgi:hypothetical protein